MGKINLLFLGYAVSKQRSKELSGISIAGNNMQIALLKELYRYDDINLSVITVPPVATFPKDKKIIWNTKKQEIENNICAVEVGFINIPILKQISQSFTTYISAKKIIKQQPDTVILTFNMFPQIGAPSLKMKNKYGTEVVALLADPPIDIKKRNILESFVRKAYYKKTERYIEQADKLIVLNDELIKLYAPNKPYIVIDGAIDISEFKDGKSKEKITKKNIVFSGALTEYNGIREAISAMSYVSNESITLDIYGNGPLEEYVKQQAKTNKNVKYYGSVDNDTMRKLQQEAFLLINPRTIDDQMSRLTFPSKILEYMMSGTPILTTRLNGFSEDYFDKMFFVKTNEPEELGKAIDEIALLPECELSEIAKRAYEFVTTKKTWSVQAAEIVKFLKKE